MSLEGSKREVRFQSRMSASAGCGHSIARGYGREVPIAEVGPTRYLVSTGKKRGRPSRSITTETLTMVDQLDQHYKRSGCNPGKCPDTRRMVFASRTGSRDIARDRYLAVLFSGLSRRKGERGEIGVTRIECSRTQ